MAAHFFGWSIVLTAFSLVRSLEESDETESQISAYRDLPYSMAKWIPIEYLSHFITSILFNAFTAGLRINSTSILDATDSAPDAAAAEELKKGRKNRRNKRQQRNQRQQQTKRNLVILQEEVEDDEEQSVTSFVFCFDRSHRSHRSLHLQKTVER